MAVVNILANIFGMVLNKKWKTWIEKHKILGEKQSGFREGTGGLENILILIIDRNRQQKKELYLVFLDIEKAFASVDRQKFIKLLKHIGVDKRIVSESNRKPIC